MKPPLRIKSVSTKVSEAEFAMLEERARGTGLRLAELEADIEWTMPFCDGLHLIAPLGLASNGTISG